MIIVDDHLDSFAPISPLLPGVLLQQADKVSRGKLKWLHEDPEEQAMGTEQESGLGLSKTPAGVVSGAHKRMGWLHPRSKPGVMGPSGV